MDTPKLVKVKRLDTIRLDENDQTYFTDEGYLIDHPVLTSVGIFEYTNPDGSIRRELRLPKYVFDEKSLKSYKGKPIIITHDAGIVDKDNVSDEEVGTILSDGYQDGDDVRAEIVIHDTDKMKKSGLRELSLGYNLDLIEEPGTWHGEHYDAIQTNIVVNHLALVMSARAGDQARLNIDSTDAQTLRGGKKMARINFDDAPLSPDELKEAIEQYKAKKAQSAPAPETPAPKPEQPTNDADDEPLPVNPDDENQDEDTGETPDVTPEGVLNAVKSNKEKRDGEDAPTDMKAANDRISRQDADIDALVSALEKLIAQYKGDEKTSLDDEYAPDLPPVDNQDCGTNKDADDDTDQPDAEAKNPFDQDSSDDKSDSLNMDSADRIFRQRLHMCRIGDRLNMDGLETKSLMEGKKAIIKKVMPEMRLDGKDKAYIDAAFDIAAAQVKRPKDADYQRKQMVENRRNDGFEPEYSMASIARQRMIEREGGNE